MRTFSQTRNRQAQHRQARVGRRLIAVALVALATTLSPVGRSARAAATLPAGYVDELVASISAPTALAFTPDGRILVTTQPGALRVIRNGALNATPALTLPSTKVCSNSERGLLGVAVDPAFAVNHRIYAFYTFNKFSNSCPTTIGAQRPVNRVSRFVLGDNDIVDPNSETVLVDNMPSLGIHNAGDLQFGSDGSLFITVGDGGCDYLGDSGCAGNNDAARDEFTLTGKLLRITTDGNIPADNPFLGDGTVRCATTGGTTPGNRCQETYASGFRNPFRMAVDPDTPGRVFVNDVGQDTLEEIDAITPGADYGWNYREGTRCNSTFANCAKPGLTAPIFEYNHNTGCGSITGAAFVPDGAWGGAYDTAYMYADYVCGKIFALTPNGAGGYTNSTFATGLGNSSAVAMRFGPSPSGPALYYTTYESGGSIRRVVKPAAAPVVTVSASPTNGPLPLDVNFTATATPSGTYDYLWDFGDTATAITATGQTSHVYTTAGRYTATVRARTPSGLTSAPASATITAGNTPPSVSIVAPSTFAVGTTISASASGTDTIDGTLPPTAFTWRAFLRHDTHTHPLAGPTTGRTFSLPGPAPEGFTATQNSHVELHVVATDSGGATTERVAIVNPRRVTLTFATSPTGLALNIGGATIVAPTAFVSWEKWVIRIEAPLSQAGRQFRRWSDFKARIHTITTPASAKTFTATYR